MTALEFVTKIVTFIDKNPNTKNKPIRFYNIDSDIPEDRQYMHKNYFFINKCVCYIGLTVCDDDPSEYYINNISDLKIWFFDNGVSRNDIMAITDSYGFDDFIRNIDVSYKNNHIAIHFW